MSGESAPLAGEIWAFDIASTTGVCEGVPGQTPRLYTKRLSFPHDGPYEAGARTLKFVAERLKMGAPEAVVLEAPIAAGQMKGGTNAQTGALLNGLAWVVGSAFKLYGVPVYEANVRSVRKTFIGAGNVPGAEAKRRTVEMCRRLGWEPPNHDAADAAACWYWLCAKRHPLLAHHVTPLLKGLNDRRAL